MQSLGFVFVVFEFNVGAIMVETAFRATFWIVRDVLPDINHSIIHIIQFIDSYII